MNFSCLFLSIFAEFCRILFFMLYYRLFPYKLKVEKQTTSERRNAAMTKKISHLLLSLGIPSTRLGHHYLCYALELCLKDEDYLLAVYKLLYVDVARHFNTTRDNVEHCMRTAVSCFWDRGNKDLLSNIAAYPLIEKPTTGEFLDILYHYLSQ